MERDHASDLYFLDILRPPPGNAINMVGIREYHEGSVHTLPEDGDSSTRSTRYVHTDDDEYDLDPLPYPLGFSPIPRFPPRHGDMVLNVSNDEPAVVGETDEQGNFTNSVTPTVPNAISMRPKKKKHVAGYPDLEIWLTPSTE
jgi:hypothetical protein